VTDPRDDFIADLVRGKSFVDVGGLWGTDGEKVSVAHRAGASSLAMIDIAPPGHDSWQAFTARCVALGVPNVRLISGDLVRLAAETPTPEFEVVHCSGVLYHTPNPMATLTSLRKMTRQYLILSSSIIGTRVENDAGVLEVPRAAAVFVPGLRDNEWQIVSSHWRPHVGGAAMGLTQQLAGWRLDNHIAWWWLPTPHAMKSMCEAAGFVCEAEGEFWSGNVLTIKLAVDETRAPHELAAPGNVTAQRQAGAAVEEGRPADDELSDLRIRVTELEQDKALIDHERQQLRKSLAASQAWVGEIERGKAWLEEQRASWEREALESAEQARVRQLRIAELEETNAWLEEQRSRWQQTATEYSQRLSQAS